MILSHHNLDIIQDWIRALRLQAESLMFEDKYVRGSQLGQGKFSTVY
jgi:hypothetical protein